MIVGKENIFPLGDTAITVRLGDQRSNALLDSIHAVVSGLKRSPPPSVHDIVPSYLGVTLFYDPGEMTFARMREYLAEHLSRIESARFSGQTAHEHVILVRYDGADLDEVARLTKLAREDVVALHTGGVYRVDLLGFVPGWAYLSGLDARLELPRRQKPRPKVKAGSVAIAALQTGIYPLDTPGGWHILGSTDTVIFDPARDPPALLAPGDTVRFVSAN